MPVCRSPRSYPQKNIDKQVLIDALQAAMLTAARKKYGLTADLEARYDEELGVVTVYEFKRVVNDVSNHSIEITLENAKRKDPTLTDEVIGEEV